MIFMAILISILGLNPGTAEARVASCNQLFVSHSRTMKVSVGHTERVLTVFRKPQKKRAPVVIYFHGTNVPVRMDRNLDAPYGLANESRFIQKLVEAGFVVVAPNANRIVPYYVLPAVSAWEANISPYSRNFENSRDFQLTAHLLDSLPDIIGSAADTNRIFLAGFSSGGYMASRLALEPSIASRIRGLVVHSASYGHCVGNQCSIPSELPEWHPETLLIANKDDSVVPFYTVEMYEKRLKKNNIATETLFSEEGEHAWNDHHPDLIFDWMKAR
jgi:poly(3-hydroxyoctanoate) depolymerase